jgi:dimethylhistidine N-methyltransferase
MPQALQNVNGHSARGDESPLARDVLAGLSQRPKSIPSAWFYDQRGSALFQQITELDEYYLTRCEAEILQSHGPRLAELLSGDAWRIVELGAGDGRKTEVLLRSFLAAGLEFEYVPIDICPEAVHGLTRQLRRRFDKHDLRVRPIAAEYADAWRELRRAGSTRQLVLFLGSSIGNFSDSQARRFLINLCESLRPGDLALVGFDLKKDVRILQRAYDDAAGVTREFNFNLLARINRELGGHFDADRFVHHAAYNPAEGCMESWLISRQPQDVRIDALDRSFHFRAWEGMRLERSHKYDLTQIEAFAVSSGFQVCQHLLDVRGYFCDSLWEASPTSHSIRRPSLEAR